MRGAGRCPCRPADGCRRNPQLRCPCSVIATTLAMSQFRRSPDRVDPLEPTGCHHAPTRCDRLRLPIVSSLTRLVTRGGPRAERLWAVIIVGLLGSTVRGQAPARPPVIDVHVHSTNTSPQQALERMKSLNIRFLSRLQPRERPAAMGQRARRHSVFARAGLSLRRWAGTDHGSPLLLQRDPASRRDLVNGRTEGRTYQSVQRTLTSILGDVTG